MLWKNRKMWNGCFFQVELQKKQKHVSPNVVPAKRLRISWIWQFIRMHRVRVEPKPLNSILSLTGSQWKDFCVALMGWFPLILDRSSPMNQPELFNWFVFLQKTWKDVYENKFIFSFRENLNMRSLILTVFRRGRVRISWQPWYGCWHHGQDHTKMLLEFWSSMVVKQQLHNLLPTEGSVSTLQPASKV